MRAEKGRDGREKGKGKMGKGRGGREGGKVGPQAKASPRTIFLAPALGMDDSRMGKAVKPCLGIPCVGNGSERRDVAEYCPMAFTFANNR